MVLPRIGIAVLGGAVLLIGLAATAAAGLQASEGGYFTSPSERLTTRAGVLVSDEIEVGEADAHAADPDPDVGELARVRIQVRATDPAVPLFVGIAARSDARDFLKGSNYDEFVSARLDPFDATFRRAAGGSLAGDPGPQNIWVAASSGSGIRTLEWDKTHGPWSVVVMRLDGKQGLDVTASIGLRFAQLIPIGIGGILAGSLLIGALILRRPRSTQHPQ